MQLDGDAQAFPHGRDSHPVDVVHRDQGVQFGQGGPGGLGAGGNAVGE